MSYVWLFREIVRPPVRRLPPRGQPNTPPDLTGEENMFWTYIALACAVVVFVVFAAAKKSAAARK